MCVLYRSAKGEMMMVRKITKGDRCEFKGCRRMAGRMAYSKSKEVVMKLCKPHAKMVLEHHSPEYVMSCQNCGCHIPVN